MTETLHRTATLEFERGIATTCESKRCDRGDELHAFVVTGAHGRDGIVVYCPRHADVREESDSHTYLGRVVDDD